MERQECSNFPQVNKTFNPLGTHICIALFHRSSVLFFLNKIMIKIYVIELNV